MKEKVVRIARITLLALVALDGILDLFLGRWLLAAVKIIMAIVLGILSTYKDPGYPVELIKQVITIAFIALWFWAAIQEMISHQPLFTTLRLLIVALFWNFLWDGFGDDLYKKRKRDL